MKGLYVVMGLVLIGLIGVAVYLFMRKKPKGTVTPGNVDAAAKPVGCPPRTGMGAYWDRRVGDVSKADKFPGLASGAISNCGGQWYYNGIGTCVGQGDGGSNCPGDKFFCAGVDDKRASHAGHYGFSEDQLRAVIQAINSGGVHSNCPR